MSYSSTDFRKPIRSRSQQISGVKFVRKLKTKRTKSRPAWDDSVNDLTVHKPSPHELKRNHELHKPKKDHERLLRRMETARVLTDDADDSIFFYGDERNTTAAAFRRKDVLRKQGFYDQEREISELLSETDKTIAEVQDIFGDAIYKYRSIPAFTKAPNFTGGSENNHLLGIVPDNVSYYDTLSESVVRELNPSSISEEEEDGSSDSEHDVEKGPSLKHNAYRNRKGTGDEVGSFKSKMNVGHYKDILNQNSNTENIPESVINVPDLQFLSEELTKSIKENNLPVSNNPKTTTSIPTTNDNIVPQNSALQTFDDMKKMLDVLESEIDEYEKETGKDITPKTKVPSSISGYTAHLIHTIIRLTNHLKQSDVQLKAEMAMRTEILDMFDDQRKLVDVLTNNLMELEENNDTLKKELDAQKIFCQNNHSNLKKDLQNLENRFNLAFAKDDFGKHVERKPFGDVTNTHGMSWIEN